MTHILVSLLYLAIVFFFSLKILQMLLIWMFVNVMQTKLKDGCLVPTKMFFFCLLIIMNRLNWGCCWWSHIK